MKRVGKRVRHETGDPVALERSTYCEWAHHIEAGISTVAASPVHLVMRRDVTTVLRTCSEETLVELMIERGLGQLPVVDDHGALVGFVTAVDLLRAREDDPELVYGPPAAFEGGPMGAGFHDAHAPRDVVEDMEPVPVTLGEHDSLAKALMLMASAYVDRAPVVGKDGRLLGMLHAGDALAWLLEQRGLPHLARHQDGAERTLERLPAPRSMPVTKRNGGVTTRTGGVTKRNGGGAKLGKRP